MNIHNWDDVLAALSAWKQKFSTTIWQRDPHDVAEIAHYGLCSVGKWLQGEGKTKYAGCDMYNKVLEAHANLHKEASFVASAADDGNYDLAEAMIQFGTPFTISYQACVSAVLMAKKEGSLDRVTVYPRVFNASPVMPL